jgi:hypothetical protein
LIVVGVVVGEEIGGNGEAVRWGERAENAGRRGGEVYYVAPEVLVEIAVHGDCQWGW